MKCTGFIWLVAQLNGGLLRKWLSGSLKGLGSLFHAVDKTELHGDVCETPHSRNTENVVPRTDFELGSPLIISPRRVSRRSHCLWDWWRLLHNMAAQTVSFNHTANIVCRILQPRQDFVKAQSIYTSNNNKKQTERERERGLALTH